MTNQQNKSWQGRFNRIYPPLMTKDGTGDIIFAPDTVRYNIEAFIKNELTTLAQKMIEEFIEKVKAEKVIEVISPNDFPIKLQFKKSLNNKLDHIISQTRQAQMKLLKEYNIKI